MHIKTLVRPSDALRPAPQDGPQIDYVASLILVSSGIHGNRVDIQINIIPDILHLPIQDRLRTINKSPVLLAFVESLAGLKERFPGIPTLEQLAEDRKLACGEAPASPAERRKHYRDFNFRHGSPLLRPA